VVNSHASAPGDSVQSKDAATGTLLSPPFKISRNYISFRIGGGNHNPNADINLLTGKGNAGGTGMELWIDGKPVRFVTGHNANQMRVESMDVTDLQGKTAQLKIIDRESGGWGNVGIDEIVFTDQRRTEDAGPLEQRYDFGTLALALVGQTDHAAASATKSGIYDTDNPDATKPWGEPLTGALSKTFKLDPQQEQTVTFVFAWHFPNLTLDRLGKVGRHYQRRFKDAAAVAAHVAANVDRLYSATRRWTETWYDSSLPYWLLDRTMANTSILATNTFYHFENGRFYGWEGINCCEGTCAHVWHYAQAPGRLFPRIERNIRQRVDFGIAFGQDGAIHYRGEVHDHHADDGQCGRILGVLREHQMSPNDAFLRELWPKVKKSVEFMMQRDENKDGLLDGAQPNTLDAAWYGKNPNFARHWQYGYFNECMSGFEWQAAAHMIWEGHDQPDLLENGLAVSRAIHDRYDGHRRNPYNEIECSDHYARSMASYGVFQAVCGFEYHGPKGHIGFAPRLGPTDFKAAFTAAEGWGTFAQRRKDGRQHETIAVKWGRLSLRTLAFVVPRNMSVNQVKVSAGNRTLPCSHDAVDGRLTIELERAVILEDGQMMAIAIS
jgi:hypothetical protein